MLNTNISEVNAYSYYYWSDVNDCSTKTHIWATESSGSYHKVYLGLRLNGVTNGQKTGSEGDTNLFLNNTSGKFEYLQENSNWVNLISDEYWGLKTADVGNLPPENYVVTGGIAKAKIGLIYLSDYYFTMPEEGTSDFCHDQYKCKESWMYFENCGIDPRSSKDYELTLTFGTEYNDYGCRRWFKIGGKPTEDQARYGYAGENYSPGFVRPVFLLDTSALITGGNGSLSNPFIIST